MAMKIHKLNNYSQRTFQFVKKHPIAFGFFFWLLLLTLPALLLDLSPQNMDYLAFLGAIIGGGIGGLFTLWGVLHTIQDQNEQKYIDAFPAKDRALVEVISTLGRIKKQISQRENISSTEMNSLRDTIGLAASVDGHTYMVVHVAMYEIEVQYQHYKSLLTIESDAIGNWRYKDDPRLNETAKGIVQTLHETKISLFKHRDKMISELRQKTGV